MTPVVGIDPGTTSSAYLVWDGQAKEILELGYLNNTDLIVRMRNYPHRYPLGIEMVRNFGSPFSNDMVETIVYTGRLIEAWEAKDRPVMRETRKSIVTYLCNDSKAKDGWVRQSLINRFGQPGTKKNPGALYEVSEHAWQALAVAVTIFDKLFQPMAHHQ